MTRALAVEERLRETGLGGGAGRARGGGGEGEVEERNRRAAQDRGRVTSKVGAAPGPGRARTPHALGQQPS